MTLALVRSWPVLGALTAGGRSVFDELRSPVLVLDESGRIIETNSPAVELFGVDSGAVVTEPIDDILGGDVSFKTGPEGSMANLSFAPTVVVETQARATETQLVATDGQGD